MSNEAQKKEKTLRFCLSHQVLPEKPKSTKKIWVSPPKPNEEITRIQEKSLLQSISFAHCQASSLKLGLYQYSLISSVCKNTQTPIKIPETIVFGYGFERPSMLYTDPSGFLRTQSKLNILQLEHLALLFNFYKNSLNKPFPIPIAIQKSPNSSYDKILMKNLEFLSEMKNGLKSDTIVQRYILPKGSKCCKIRVIYKEKQELKLYMITNRNRFDGKKDKNPKIENKLIVERNETELQIQEPKVEGKSNNVFGTVHENASKFIETSKTDNEVFALGRKYVYERSLANQMIELEAEELPSSMLHSQQKHKSAKAAIAKSISESMQPEEKVRKVTRKGLSEFEKYLEEVLWELEEPEDSLENLYKKLYNLSSSTVQESTNKEEASINPAITTKLRTIFCLDMHLVGKVSIIQIKSKKGYLDVENMMTAIRKGLNHYLVRNNNEEITGLVCDFGQDEAKQFYFLKIKHYSVKTVPFPIELRESENEFECPGRYCYNEHHEDEPSQESKGKPKFYQILRKTLIEDENDQVLEKMIKPYLHQTLIVCYNCFVAYMKKEKLKVLKYMKPEKKEEINVYKYRFSRPIGQIKSISMAFKPDCKKAPVEKRTHSAFFVRKKLEVIEACRDNDF